MKDKIMKSLIVDNIMLVYLHDLLSIRESNESFYQTDLYETLIERTITTVILGLKRTFLIFLSFSLIIKYLKHINLSNFMFLSIALLLSIIYGYLVLISKNEISDLSYQIKLKRAVRFSLEQYTYQEFVIFLDNYLSEQSSEMYLKKSNIYSKNS